MTTRSDQCQTDFSMSRTYRLGTIVADLALATGAASLAAAIRNEPLGLYTPVNFLLFGLGLLFVGLSLKTMCSWEHREQLARYYFASAKPVANSSPQGQTPGTR